MTEKQSQSPSLSQRLGNYIAYRQAQLDYQESQIGQPGDLSMGSHIAKREAIVMARWALSELVSLLGWLEVGEPEFVAPLSEQEKEFWEKARVRGVEIPADIEAQLRLCPGVRKRSVRSALRRAGM